MDDVANNNQNSSPSTAENKPQEPEASADISSGNIFSVGNLNPNANVAPNTPPASPASVPLENKNILNNPNPVISPDATPVTPLADQSQPQPDILPGNLDSIPQSIFNSEPPSVL